MHGTLYARSAIQHWRSVTVLFVLGASLIGLAAAQREPEFRSHVQLMARFTKVARVSIARISPATPPQSPANPTPTLDLTSAVSVAKLLGVDERLIESRVRTYAQKTTGVGIPAAVRNSLRLPYSADEVRSRIAASSPLNTTLIDIVVRDTDRTRAVAVSAAVAAELIKLADEEKLPDGEEESLKLRLTVSEAPYEPASSVAVPGLRLLISGSLGGLAFSVGLATLRVLLRRRHQTLRDWVGNGWRSQMARTRSFARLASERFWGPGWR
ncbi:hypothetical protein Drose_00580 [Dactylosporangium roseum]|uniref:Capsular polysaccharide biosynthesis protein n=1 Tax=Dactylosporangium roseum TaxID=47989 RepID=A0ABY5Z4V3_9ACTN|nr:hypothetical protein [Dactylosporangium roseum]UWZ36872.1 hypothetical protein Drose_00580 [Dactylosporangium roseum]